MPLRLTAIVPLIAPYSCSHQKNFGMQCRREALEMVAPLDSANTAKLAVSAEYIWRCDQRHRPIIIIIIIIIWDVVDSDLLVVVVVVRSFVRF